MASRPRVLIEPRDLPASPDGIPAARVWDIVLEYPGAFTFRHKRPARSRAQAETWQGRFDAKLRRGETPDLTSHWIGRTEEIQGRLTAPPIVRVSRRWEPGLQVIRDGETNPTRPAATLGARGFRLILVGPARIYQHPDVFVSQEIAERTREQVQEELHAGRDLVGGDWEFTDLFPYGRTIAYLPSLRVLDTKCGRDRCGLRFNFFVSDADRFTSSRSLRPGAELRLTATTVSYRQRLQWRVTSLERILGV